MSEVCAHHEVCEWRIKAAEIQLEKHEEELQTIGELTKAIYEISTAIKQVVQTQDIIIQTQQKHDTRITIIEDAPGIVAIKGWIFVGCFILTALGGYFLGRFGL